MLEGFQFQRERPKILSKHESVFHRGLVFECAVASLGLEVKREVAGRARHVDGQARCLDIPVGHGDV